MREPNQIWAIALADWHGIQVRLFTLAEVDEYTALQQFGWKVWAIR